MHQIFDSEEIGDFVVKILEINGEGMGDFIVKILKI